MRVFYIEPFLRRSESHFVEVAFATYSYLEAQPGIKLHMVGHRSLNQDIMRLFPKVLPGVSQTCFEDLNNKGQSFYSDLISLDKQFSFAKDDLFIIPTAYENQIIGAALFAEHLNKRCPMISMQFHQLFPPAQESDIIYSLRFRRYWMKRLRDAFSSRQSHQISYWTTESAALNLAYRRLSKCPVGVLTVPYKLDDEMQTQVRAENNERLRVGYVGDGRQEKGLLYFLHACSALAETKRPFSYILQLNNPRGFSPAQQVQFEHELNRFKVIPDAELITSVLPPSEHHALIRSLDILVLPYNPAHYWRRISGLLIQAAIQQCIVVASSGTWAATAIRKKRAAGIVFDYVNEDKVATTSNIVDSINQVTQEQSYFVREASIRSSYYRSQCQAAVYVGRILEHYGCA